MAGRRTNIRFTGRKERTIASHDCCSVKDGDRLYAEDNANGAKLPKAITLEWDFRTGTGRFDEIQGMATDTNSSNLADTDQAGGAMTGSHGIVRSRTMPSEGTRDQSIGAKGAKRFPIRCVS